MKATLHFDGGARPTNPGHAGFACVLRLLLGDPVDAVRDEYLSRHIGWKTNNEAEYTGLIAGLKMAIEFQVTEIECVSDSKLVVNQVLGNWKIKEPRLRPFVFEARKLAQEFEQFKMRHVPRAQNTLADKLCTEAILYGMRNPYSPKRKNIGKILDPFSRTRVQ